MRRTIPEIIKALHADEVVTQDEADRLVRYIRHQERIDQLLTVGHSPEEIAAAPDDFHAVFPQYRASILRNLRRMTGPQKDRVIREQLVYLGYFVGVAQPAADGVKQRALVDRQRGGSQSHREQQAANADVLRALGDGPIRLDALERYVDKRNSWPVWVRTDGDRKHFLTTEAQRLRAARRSEKARGTKKNTSPREKRRNPQARSKKKRAR